MLNKLKTIINEAVRNAIYSLMESKSIKSRKLQQIVSKYGGFYNEGRGRYYYPKRGLVDLHNANDEDVIGVFSNDDIRYMGKGDNDLWRFALAHGAKNLEPTDRIYLIPLADKEHHVLVVARSNAIRNYCNIRDERQFRKSDFDGAERYMRPYDVGHLLHIVRYGKKEGYSDEQIKRAWYLLRNERKNYKRNY